MLRGDWDHLYNCLDRFHPHKRAKHKAEYKRRFLEAYDAEEVEQKKANAGRRAANLYFTENEIYEDIL